MAGLHELVMGHDRIQIAYTALTNGCEVLYTTEDPARITALHAWFGAQLADHGSHAQGQH
ncbi:MAG: hypothetical protein SH809_19015 [Rhodothermales bacterium]|nr:hypothetical protein [Rhodothermales bacterium]